MRPAMLRELNEIMVRYRRDSFRAAGSAIQKATTLPPSHALSLQVEPIEVSYSQCDPEHNEFLSVLRPMEMNCKSVVRYNVTGSGAPGGSFSTPFQPTGRPLTASFTERNNTMYINWR